MGAVVRISSPRLARLNESVRFSWAKGCDNAATGDVKCRSRLGGLLNFYFPDTTAFKGKTPYEALRENYNDLNPVSGKVGLITLLRASAFETTATYPPAIV